MRVERACGPEIRKAQRFRGADDIMHVFERFLFPKNRHAD